MGELIERPKGERNPLEGIPVQVVCWWDAARVRWCYALEIRAPSSVHVETRAELCAHCAGKITGALRMTRTLHP